MQRDTRIAGVEGLEPLPAKEVAAACGPAVAQARSAAGCSVNDRESPWVTLLTGTRRARPDLKAVRSAAVCAAPGPVSLPDRPGGDAEGDDGVDRPAARPDSDHDQGEQDPGGLGGAHQVL